MQYSVVKSRRLVSEVRKLGDANRKTLGFLPAGAFEDYAAKEHIIAAIDNSHVCGYLMYRYKRAKIIIVHLCVSDEYRSKGIATGLLSALEAKEAYYSELQLSCRRDYQLDRFWQSLGFTALAEREGRAVLSKSILTVWLKRNPDNPSLFDTTSPASTDKIQAVIDTNIVIDMCDGTNEEVNLLLQDYLNNYVSWYVSKAFFDEINQNENNTLRNRHREYAQNHCITIEEFNDDNTEEIRKTLLLHKPTEKYSNKWYDISHIASAISFGAALFITNDKEWLNNSFAEFVLKEYGLSIFSPSVFLKYIDEVNTPHAYSPRSLIGLDLEYKALMSEDVSMVLNTLYTQFPEGRKKDFRNILNVWLSNPKTHKTLYVSSKDKPVCLVLYVVSSFGEDVQYILIDSNQIQPKLQRTFISRIAFMLLEDAAKKQVSEIKIPISCLTAETIPVFLECGYSIHDQTLHRLIVNKIVKHCDIPSVLLSFPNNNGLFHKMQKQLQGVDPQYFVDLEKLMWPMKISDAGIPCFIVPIQAKYAQELFDEELLNINMSLFKSATPEASLSLENVYFKKKRNSISSFPARILWYVSNDPKLIGTKAIRACSYLDYSEVATMKQLYTKYRRLGVMAWDDMKIIGEVNSDISAYSFSYTELFRNGVSLDAVRKEINRPTETFVSYKKITEAQFMKIYELGKCGNG